jgi:hypothetical protein
MPRTGATFSQGCESICSSEDPCMVTKLSKELAAALHATGETELEVVNPETARTYFLVDRETHLRAMEALRRQQDRDAIARGIAEMEAGEGVSIDEVAKLTRAKLVARKP